MHIDGVGHISAEAIYYAVADIKRSALRDVVPRIDPDHMSQEAVELLRSIYYKRHYISGYEKIQEDINRLIEESTEDFALAKQKRNFFGRLFQSKRTKKAIDEAIERLNSQKFRNKYNETKKDYQSLIDPAINDEQLMNHYIEENISYYVEIENVIGVDPSRTTDDLPTEIVKEINAFPLNKDGLNIEFRSYQEFGTKYALHFKRTLLGDEMGLGKTVQALGLINHLYQEGKRFSIVVCPLSILSNWKREIDRFSKVPVFVFHGASRDRELAKWQGEAGVLLTTYEHTVHLNLENQPLHALVVDEAHYVKNPEARRSRNVYRLSDESEYVLFMSGTPLENNVDEMKQLVSVLNPSVGSVLSEHLYMLEPKRFKQTIQEIYLRRNRHDVLDELPELEILEEWVPFGRKELLIYREAVMGGHLMLMRRAAWLGKEPRKSPKLERLIEICNHAKENRHKVIVFSFFKDVLRIVHNHLHGRTFDIISGDVPNRRRQEIIDQFSKAEAGSVLISQITAGGVGLNIQAANIVILCEPQWKPSTENQAISRAYRMGQARKVLVYRLLTEESIDESMLDVLGYKEEIFDLYARESEITDVVIDERDIPEDENVSKKVLQMEKERVEKKIV